MKKIAFLILLFAFTIIVKAQDTTVEKSIFGVQTGFLGFWAFNESELTENIALRTELGLDYGFTNFTKSLVMTPVITLEPRWYYNINKRVENDKNTAYNSANFFAITARYNPNWFVISKNSNIDTYSQILIAPKWGIKRSIGSHFNYELGLGLGVRYYLDSNTKSRGRTADLGGDLHIRIGYHF